MHNQSNLTLAMFLWVVTADTLPRTAQDRTTGCDCAVDQTGKGSIVFATAVLQAKAAKYANKKLLIKARLL